MSWAQRSLILALAKEEELEDARVRFERMVRDPELKEQRPTLNMLLNEVRVEQEIRRSEQKIMSTWKDGPAG